MGPRFLIGTTLGWDAVDVVRWQSVEGLSEPFSYCFVVAREAERGPIAAASLVGTGAIFSIASEARFRLVHDLSCR